MTSGAASALLVSGHPRRAGREPDRITGPGAGARGDPGTSGGPERRAGRAVGDGSGLSRQRAPPARQPRTGPDHRSGHRAHEDPTPSGGRNGVQAVPSGRLRPVSSAGTPGAPATNRTGSPIRTPGARRPDTLGRPERRTGRGVGDGSGLSRGRALPVRRVRPDRDRRPRHRARESPEPSGSRNGGQAMPSGTAPACLADGHSRRAGHDPDRITGPGAEPAKTRGPWTA